MPIKTYKDARIYLWTINKCTVRQLYAYTREVGTDNYLSYAEFKEQVGIEVDYYVANKEIYKDMHYKDVQEMLKDK